MSKSMANSFYSSFVENSSSMIAEEINQFHNELQNDRKEFEEKFNSTRENFLSFIHQSTKILREIEEHYRQEFNYLQHENVETCKDNEKQLDHLISDIDRYHNDPNSIAKILQTFRHRFPQRPRLVDNIPTLQFQPISFQSLIQEMPRNGSIDQNEFPVPVTNVASTIDNVRLSSNENLIELVNLSDDDQPQETSITVPKPGGSIGNSSHRKFAASEIPSDKSIRLESQLRSISTVSNNAECHGTLPIAFQISYGHRDKDYLMTHHINDNFLLFYSMKSRQFSIASITERQITPIGSLLNEPLLTIGYSSSKTSLYLLTKDGRLIFFRVRENEMANLEEIELMEKNDRSRKNIFLGHIYDDYLFFFTRSSTGEIALNKFHFEEKFLISSIPLRNLSYDNNDQFDYEIIDFALNEEFIYLLVRLNDQKKFIVVVFDHELNEILPFDLLDAQKPLSIVLSKRPNNKMSQRTTSDSLNDAGENLLFINDPWSHQIHCCTGENYLVSIDINAFAISMLPKGILALIGKKDIRGLKIHQHLQSR